MGLVCFYFEKNIFLTEAIRLTASTKKSTLSEINTTLGNILINSRDRDGGKIDRTSTCSVAGSESPISEEQIG